MDEQQGAVVLLSGGQDSSTCLAWAMNKWRADRVYPLILNYQQRHQVEIECAYRVANELGVSTPILELPVPEFNILGSAALTSSAIEVNANAESTGNVYAEKHGLPSTFVPGRNMLFLTLAAAYGAKLGILNTVTGICATDRAGYPDCRLEFATAALTALEQALDEPNLDIWTPLLSKSKGQTFQMAEDLGVLPIIREHTHTCYEGVRDELHDWGYGCGTCPACVERLEGWEEYRKYV